MSPPTDRRGLSPGELYVDPVTDILCRVPERRPAWKRVRTEPDDIVVVGDDELRRIDGVWYWMLFAGVPPPTMVDNVVINHLDENTIPTRRSRMRGDITSASGRPIVAICGGTVFVAGVQWPAPGGGLNRAAARAVECSAEATLGADPLNSP